MLRSLVDMEAGERVMKSTNLETLSLFQRVSQSLAEGGHQRTAQQARAKFKMEKSAFFACLEENGGDQSDAPEGSRMWLLHQLWVQADRPTWERRLAGSKHQIPTFLTIEFDSPCVFVINLLLGFWS